MGRNSTTRWLIGLLIPTAVITASCADDRGPDPIAPETPPPPSAAIAIADEVQGLFFFSPPVGSGGTATALFDPTLLPALFLEFCEAGELVDGTCPEDKILARYTSTEAGPDGNTIQVLTSEEQYKVEVQFRNLPGASDGDSFTGRVGIGDPTGTKGTDFLIFGSFDVSLGNGAGVEDDLEANPNRTLPVKWFAGEGLVIAALGGDTSDDAVAGTCTDAGCEIETPSGFYKVVVDENSLPEGVDAVTIAIEPTTPTAQEPCVGTFAFGLQEEGCADFTAIPDITFANPVTVGVCLDSSVLSNRENYQLAKDDGTDVELLPNVPVTIDCTGFLAGGTASSFLPQFAANGLDAVTRQLKGLFGARRLWASDTGFGGSTLDFSFIGWVLVPDIEVSAGDDQVATHQTEVTLEAIVQSAHFDANDGPVALSGVPVTWMVTGSGGSVIPVSATTDANGLAQAVLTVVGGTPGVVNTVEASAGLDTVTFSAFGIEETFGSMSDTTDDETSPPGPDLVSASAEAQGTDLIADVRFNTADPENFESSSRATWSLDIDQDTNTGHPGVDAGGNDDDLLGTDFLVTITGDAFQASASASVLQFAGSFNTFTTVLSGLPVTVHADGYEVSIPLETFGSTFDAVFNFKIAASEQLSAGSFTAVRDYMTDLGQPPGTTSPPIIIQ